MCSPLTSLFAGIIHRLMHRTLALHSQGWRDTSMLSGWPWGPLPRSTCLPSLPSRLPSNSSGINGRGCRAAPGRAAWEPRHPIHTVVLSSCKARRIGSPAAKCSNQADLHLTFTAPIWPSDLPQRPSLTSMPLATYQMIAPTCGEGGVPVAGLIGESEPILDGKLIAH
jgi:hypothetical protein